MTEIGRTMCTYFELHAWFILYEMMHQYFNVNIQQSCSADGENRRSSKGGYSTDIVGKRPVKGIPDRSDRNVLEYMTAARCLI